MKKYSKYYHDVYILYNLNNIFFLHDSNEHVNVN